MEGLVALVMGDDSRRAAAGAHPLAMPHRRCVWLAALRLPAATGAGADRIAEEGAGILLYEQQEGRGIGLMAKLKAYELQDQGRDTVEANEELGFAADCREYDLAAEALKLLGVKSVRLMTNNPDKVAALEAAGITVTERVSAEVETQESFERYLRPSRRRWATFSNTLTRSTADQIRAAFMKSITGITSSLSRACSAGKRPRAPVQQ